MKKDRNAFFNEANFSQSSYMGNPNIPMNNNFPGGMPTYANQASQSFYSGPVPTNYNNQSIGNDYMNDLESRLAKIERQINRLDARVSKLESMGHITTENYDNTTNMYML